MMLPRRYRWQGRIGGEFFLGARRVNLGWGRVYFQSEAELGVGVHAVVAGKKNFPLSTKRHLVKRRLRAAIAARLSDFAAGRYFWVVEKMLTEPPALPPTLFRR